MPTCGLQGIIERGMCVIFRVREVIEMLQVREKIHGIRDGIVIAVIPFQGGFSSLGTIGVGEVHHAAAPCP